MLISQHGDEYKYITCKECNGTGIIYIMSQEEYDDYQYNSNDGW